MHPEVKVGVKFIVSYLHNKLPRRRADLFGEELEKILMSRFDGHWYPEAPLKGSAFRCLNLGGMRDPVVELAAKKSGLEPAEVHAHVPADLSVWIDPYKVSYQIGERGLVKVLYKEDPPDLGCDSERAKVVIGRGKGDVKAKSLSFNPDAQVFVPFGSQVSSAHMPSLSSSPTPLSAQSCPGLFSYPSSSTPTDPAAHSSNTSTPSPPSSVLPYLSAQQPPSALPIARPQPVTFTTASFAATKFGSTKMKKCSGAGSAASSGAVVPPAQRVLTRSPTTISAPELLKDKPLSLPLHSRGGPIVSKLSPNAKEFVSKGSPGTLYFDDGTQPMQPHASPFQTPHSFNAHPSFDPFSSPPPGQGVFGSNGQISYMEQPPFVEGFGSYNLQYQSQCFQPVVLAN